MKNCSGDEVSIGKGEKLFTTQWHVTHYDIQLIKYKHYASLVGSVLHACNMYMGWFNFCIKWVRFQARNAGKKMLWYVKKTQSYVLSFHHVDNLELVCYITTYLEGCVDDRMWTSGFIFISNGGTISWKSKKQTIISNNGTVSWKNKKQTIRVVSTMKS